jgi:hypothetical protein
MEILEKTDGGIIQGEVLVMFLGSSIHEYSMAISGT